MLILCILHAPFETPGFIESWAQQKGFELSYVCPYAGEALADCGQSVDFIISMGGPQSATDDEPYLKEEILFLRHAIDAHIPVLGVCLGAQLIGEALGAHPELCPYKEIGLYPISLTEEGLVDPLLQGLPPTFPIMHWHGQMPGLTKEAVVLATTPCCPRQIVRFLPHVYGFQCHPEMTLQTASDLIKHCPQDLTPGPYTQTAAEILSCDYHALNCTRMAKILDNFMAILFSSKSQRPSTTYIID